MKIKNKYIKGFTLIEMIISLTITAAATAMVMFVYLESSKKYQKDNMEQDIAVYCNRTLDYISNILENAKEIQLQGTWNGFKKYRVKYTTIDYPDNIEHDVILPEDYIEKEISIGMHRQQGLVVKERNTDVTPMLLGGGAINFNTDDPNSFTLTDYGIVDFEIRQLDSDDFYYMVSPLKYDAVSNSTFEVRIIVEIRNEKDPSVTGGTKEFYQLKEFSRTAFSPIIYIIDRTSNNSSEGI